MKIIRVFVFLLILLPVLVYDSEAAELRCGSGIISIGDYRYDVYRKCGEPANVEVREEVRIRRDLFTSLSVSPDVDLVHRSPVVKEIVTIEEWQYNFGPNRFIRYLRFENGRLRSIVTGDYGY